MIYLPICNDFHVTQDVPVGTTVQSFDCHPHLPSLEKVYPWVYWPEPTLLPLIRQERWWFPEYTNYYSGSYSGYSKGYYYTKPPCIPAVPEPSTWLMFLGGIALLSFLRTKHV